MCKSRLIAALMHLVATSAPAWLIIYHDKDWTINLKSNQFYWNLFARRLIYTMSVIFGAEVDLKLCGAVVCLQQAGIFISTWIDRECPVVLHCNVWSKAVLLLLHSSYPIHHISSLFAVAIAIYLLGHITNNIPLIYSSIIKWPKLTGNSPPSLDGRAA